MTRLLADTKFRAVTYNILANAYVRSNRYPASTPDALHPTTRRSRVLATIVEQDADLYCLQEVEPDAYAAIGEALGDAYASAFCLGRTRPDGCATFVRRARFDLVGHETVAYEAGAGAQVALITHLRAGPRPLTVANTHLRWQGDETPCDEHIGRQQLLELLDWREREAATTPWLIAGDFNALSDSDVVRSALARGFELGCRTQRPWDTTNINKRRRKIDYLLYSEGQMTAAPGRLAVLDRDTPMPSLVHGSDHLPVLVEFGWLAQA